MLNVARLVKPWKESGALHSHVPWWGFVDDHTLLTKVGDVASFIHVPGIDFECIGQGELDAYTKRFEAALKLVEPSWRLYQILFRHNDPVVPHRDYPDRVVSAAMGARAAHFARRAKELYSLDVYYVLMHEVQRKGALGLASRVEAAFKTEKRADLIEHEIDQASLRLRDRRRNLLAQLSDFLPARVLDKREAFLVLRRLLNPDPRRAATPGLKYPHRHPQGPARPDLAPPSPEALRAPRQLPPRHRVAPSPSRGCPADHH